MKTRITNSQIAKLQDEAASAGDDEQVRLCEIALGVHLSDGCYPTEIEQRDARQACQEAIDAAIDEDDDEDDDDEEDDE